jgi:hypothetical protein
VIDQRRLAVVGFSHNEQICQRRVKTDPVSPG